MGRVGAQRTKEVPTLGWGEGGQCAPRGAECHREPCLGEEQGKWELPGTS